MTLSLGTKMVRSDDGMKGVVELVESPGGTVSPRVVYYDRGELRVAPKSEKWEPERAPARKLRAEEILRVAHAADRMLEALDKTLPMKWWDESPRPSVHDLDLFNLIIEHLKKRT